MKLKQKKNINIKNFRQANITLNTEDVLKGTCHQISENTFEVTLST